MPRRKKLDIFPGYTRVREPDKESLSRLVEMAKGDRSLNDFAKACGLNPSSLSRLINKKNIGASSDSVIAVIALNASPESGVTVEQLLAAHGLEPVDENRLISPHEALMMLVQSSSDESVHLMHLENAAEKDQNRSAIQIKVCMEAIMKSLLQNGYSIGMSKDVTVMRGPLYDYTADFVIETNALYSEGLNKWAFSYIKRQGIGIVFDATSFFAGAFMDSPSARGIKFSFVTDDESSFYYFKKCYRQICIPERMSILLVDPKTKEVNAEFIMHRRDCVVAPVSLFSEGNEIYEMQVDNLVSNQTNEGGQ